MKHNWTERPEPKTGPSAIPKAIICCITGLKITIAIIGGNGLVVLPAKSRRLRTTIAHHYNYLLLGMGSSDFTVRNCVYHQPTKQ